MLNFTNNRSGRNHKSVPRKPPAPMQPNHSSITRSVLEGVGIGAGSAIGRSIVEHGFDSISDMSKSPDAVRADGVGSLAKPLQTPEGSVTASSPTFCSNPWATVLLTSALWSDEKIIKSVDECKQPKDAKTAEESLDEYYKCIHNIDGTSEYDNCKILYDKYLECIIPHVGRS